jgi:hypothetical protein
MSLVNATEKGDTERYPSFSRENSGFCVPFFESSRGFARELLFWMGGTRAVL